MYWSTKHLDFKISFLAVTGDEFLSLIFQGFPLEETLGRSPYFHMQAYFYWFRVIFEFVSVECVQQDFQLQQLERRISRMQGERSNEEKLQLEARIKVKIMIVECLAMSDVLERNYILQIFTDFKMNNASLQLVHLRLL